MTEWFDIEKKECTKRRAHGRHTWWSRREDRYFMCIGHHGKPAIRPRSKK